MNRNIIIVILSIFSVSGLAQSKFPNGVYENIDQLRNGTPGFNANYRIIHRAEADIVLNGGGDYEAKSDNDSTNKKFIKETVYAYVKNDSLYINCFYHHSDAGYALCLSQGAFLAFKGIMSEGNSEEEVIPQRSADKKLAGTHVAKKRSLYVLSLRTGNVRPLNKHYLRERLKEDENLLYKFNGEPNPDSESTLIKYAGLLNTVLTIDSAVPEPQEK